VQFGHSKAPERAAGVKFMSQVELLKSFRRADLIITHGGPGTVMEALRWAPTLCVPRDPGFGEHVDSHQLKFARFMAQQGMVAVAEDRATFCGTVQGLLDQACGPRRPSRRTNQLDSLARLERVLDSFAEAKQPVRRRTALRALRSIAGTRR
jgi:UDP-N-acetylglucosamine transferase subunit ALG13